MPEWYIIGGIAAAVFGAAAASGVLKTVWRQVLRPKTKGRVGESKVSKVLRRFAHRGAKVKNDILLNREKGTSQVDHLLITKQGIISIETKNYSGVITGDTNSRLWTQSFPDSLTEPRQFYNPIRQNEGHINALRELLKGHKDIPYHSLVVFAGDCSFPHLPGVVDARHLAGTLRLLTSGPAVLSEAQIREIEKIIDRNSILDHNSREEHNFRTHLRASAPAHEIQELAQKSIQNAVYISTYVPEVPQSPNQAKRLLLTDNNAKLTIRGRTDTIEGFFEGAKRRNDGQPTFIGSNFDYFICPYTGDRFPASEALSFYHGLWIAYLNKHPELTDFMKEYGIENLGNSFRCKKVLAMYCSDKEGFIAQTRNTSWYRNMAGRQQRKPTFDQQVCSASDRCEAGAGKSGKGRRTTDPAR